MYSQLLNQHSNWVVSFRLFMNFVHGIISFLLMTKKSNTAFNLEAEIWRCIILTSHKCFPPRTIKSANTVLLNNMIVSNFNIPTNDSIGLYGAIHIPIVSYSDELIAKLVSYSHWSLVAAQGSTDH